MTVCSY